MPARSSSSPPADAARPPVHVGTSGWSYDEWKGSLYAGVPRARWLERYAETFDAVEINGTFYRLQAPSTLAGWVERTPRSFVFTIKGHRFVTHHRKLVGVEEAIERCRDNAAPLGERLAAVVWQLPASLRLDLPRLHAFLDALGRWGEVRHALEPRHRSWFRDDVAEALRRHRVAACMSDAPSWPLWDVVTTDLVYVRLHGHTRLYASAYSARSLERWARRVRGWRDEGREVHVYFDNTSEGAAVPNAQALRRAADEPA